MFSFVSLSQNVVGSSGLGDSNNGLPNPAAGRPVPRLRLHDPITAMHSPQGTVAESHRVQEMETTRGSETVVP